MKVKELIEKLKEENPELEVIVKGYNDYRNVCNLKTNKYVYDEDVGRIVSERDYDYIKQGIDEKKRGAETRFAKKFGIRVPGEMLLIG